MRRPNSKFRHLNEIFKRVICVWKKKNKGVVGLVLLAHDSLNEFLSTIEWSAGVRINIKRIEIAFLFSQIFFFVVISLFIFSYRYFVCCLIAQCLHRSSNRLQFRFSLHILLLPQSSCRVVLFANNSW